MNRHHVIQILALVRLGRFERLDVVLAESSQHDITEALARLDGNDQIALLDQIEEPARSAALMALDYADWLRLVDNAGPVRAQSLIAPAIAAPSA
ncbi:MAG: hypothetical protein ACXIUL_06760 [Wenzhouxiangella sp.]